MKVLSTGKTFERKLTKVRLLFVNVMEHYRPDAHVGKSLRSGKGSAGAGAVDGAQVAAPGGDASRLLKARYQEINRPVTEDFYLSVRKAAEDTGL